jgi:hypothetical protein
MVSLLEVVLHSPVDVVLAPWIARAPNDAAKQWLRTNYANWLTKSQENLHKLPYLPVNATEKQKKAFSFQDLYDIRLNPRTEGELEHIMDFFDSKPEIPRLERMSVQNVVQAADLWVKQMNAQAKKLPDDPKQVKTLMEFPGGYRMVDLLGQNALAKEGAGMGHCVGGGSYASFVGNGQGHIFSLRDANNEPHATIQMNSDKKTAQIKGKGNRAPVRRYWPMLREFFADYGVTVEGDHRNVGLLRIWNGDESVTMTQDQFKDMILDPDNAEGEKLLQNYEGTGQRRSWHEEEAQADMSLGLFTSLYGTSRLSDKVIEYVFANMPEHAVPVVEHYGNKFTSAQLVKAFQAMPETAANLYKPLLIITKPDASVCAAIIQHLETNSGSGRHQQPKDAAFVTALSQAMPNIYSDMLLQGGEEAIERELNSENQRAAGPFFLFVGQNGDFGDLNQQMIREAFYWLPEEAMRHLIKLGYKMSGEDLISACEGLGRSYYADKEKTKKITDFIIGYAKPDAGTVDELLDTISNVTLKMFLILAIRKEVPASLSQPTTERALESVNNDEFTNLYLAEEPNPSFEFQKYLFDKDNTGRDGNRHFGDRLKPVQVIAPEIFPLVMETLRPEAIPTIKKDYRMVTDKKNSTATHVPKKQIHYNRKLTDKEQIEAKHAHAREAIERFLKNVEAVIREPNTSDVAHLDPTSPKFVAAQQAFTKLGKSRAFEVAVSHIDKDAMRARSTDRSDYNPYRNNDQGPRGSEEFVRNLHKLRVNDIVGLIRNTYRGDYFSLLVNNAPELVPDVMAASAIPTKYHHRETYLWGDLKGKLDKEKVFEALRNVWASKRVPSGYKNDFTVKAFKRFKPGKDTLMNMLKEANNEEATRYVLKKTKNPSVELLSFVYEEFPDLLVEVPNIPQPIIERLFSDDDLRLIQALMNRDIRGYGLVDKRSKWNNPVFQSRTDPESDQYKKYEAAAQAAGKEAIFNKIIRNGQLDELVTDTEDDQRAALLGQHLNDFGIKTLVTIGHDKPEVIKTYFDNFSAEKMALIFLNGVIGHRHSWESSNGQMLPKGFFKTIGSYKIDEWLVELAEHKYDKLLEMVGEIRRDGHKISNEVMQVLLSSGSKDVSTLIDDSMDDEMKDWVADHKPDSLDHFRMPTPHVVEVTYDTYGKINQNGRDKGQVDYHFSKIFARWFNSENSYWFKYKANPVAERLAKAEAMRRKGDALKITLAMFRHIQTLRNKKNDGYLSVGTPGVRNQVTRKGGARLP